MMEECVNVCSEACQLAEGACQLAEDELMRAQEALKRYAVSPSGTEANTSIQLLTKSSYGLRERDPKGCSTVLVTALDS
jgi:hypothetical protein